RLNRELQAPARLILLRCCTNRGMAVRTGLERQLSHEIQKVRLGNPARGRASFHPSDRLILLRTLRSHSVRRTPIARRETLNGTSCDSTFLRPGGCDDERNTGCVGPRLDRHALPASVLCSLQFLWKLRRLCRVAGLWGGDIRGRSQFAMTS